MSSICLPYPDADTGALSVPPDDWGSCPTAPQGAHCEERWNHRSSSTHSAVNQKKYQISSECCQIQSSLKLPFRQ